MPRSAEFRARQIVMILVLLVAVAFFFKAIYHLLEAVGILTAP